VEMSQSGRTKGGFSRLSNQEDDSSTGTVQAQAASSGLSSGTHASAGSFANEKEEGSAVKFLISALISIGIPSFGTAKYSQVLKDNYLSRIDQLKQLDNGDWKRLGLPLVIEEALRKALQDHTNKEGRFSGNGVGGGEKRAKGLDLKAAASKKPVNATKHDSAFHPRSSVRITQLLPATYAHNNAVLILLLVALCFAICFLLLHRAKVEGQPVGVGAEPDRRR